MLPSCVWGRGDLLHFILRKEKFMKKNKKLFFILLLTLILLSFSISSFAYSNDIVYNYICDKDYYSEYVEALSNNIYYNNPDYCYFIYYNYGERVNFVVFIKKEDINISPYLSYLRTADSKNECFNIYFSSKNKEDITIYPYSLNLKNKTLSSYYPDWLLRSDGNLLFLDSCTGWINDNDLNIYFTSNCPVNIYTNSSLNTYFFPAAPQGIVAHQVETVEMSQVLQEIVALLPTILVVLVSLVGLRKGLKMLETFLRQS